MQASLNHFPQQPNLSGEDGLLSQKSLDAAYMLQLPLLGNQMQTGLGPDSIPSSQLGRLNIALVGANNPFENPKT